MLIRLIKCSGHYTDSVAPYHNDEAREWMRYEWLILSGHDINVKTSCAAFQ